MSKPTSGERDFSAMQADCDRIVRLAIAEANPHKMAALLLQWTLDNIRNGNLSTDETMAKMAGVDRDV